MEKLEEATIEKAPTEKRRKAKEPKQAVEPKSATFPIEAKVNKYCFLFLNSDVQAAWGIEKGKEYPVSIDLKEGALTVRKV